MKNIISVIILLYNGGVLPDAIEVQERVPRSTKTGVTGGVSHHVGTRNLVLLALEPVLQLVL